MQVDIQIKRIDKSLPIPTYQTPGSVAFDLYARQDCVIKAGELILIPSNICVSVPEGFALLVFSRSSMPKKKGLLKPHGVGVIDQDYCGDQDEIKIQMYNFTQDEVLVKKGDRVAQAMIVPIFKAVMHEVESMQEPSRGGFGSTDENIELTF